MTITAKFAGTCKMCGGRFEAGTRIDWSKATGAHHNGPCDRVGLRAALDADKASRTHQGCDCGSPDATWHGDTLRIFCCDACWQKECDRTGNPFVAPGETPTPMDQRHSRAAYRSSSSYPRVRSSNYARFSSGAETFSNARGRCEDAPCCRCCS